MGMFDEVVVDNPCLKCGKVIGSLQTKATACLLNVYKIGDEINFGNGKRQTIIKDGSIEVHGMCQNCKYWHDGRAVIKNGKLISIIELEGRNY